MRCDELMTLHTNIVWSQSATQLHYMGLYTNPSPDGQSFPWPHSVFWLFFLCRKPAVGPAEVKQQLANLSMLLQLLSETDWKDISTRYKKKN